MHLNPMYLYTGYVRSNKLLKVILFSMSTISSNLEVSCNLIRVPSLVHHGVEGSPLLLSVETLFSLDEAEIQGTWSHTELSGTRTTLVTFTNDHEIMDMMYRNHLLFKQSNLSLLLLKLNQSSEGEYHLSLNVKFHNSKGGVIKEERTVLVTVDGELLTYRSDKSHYEVYLLNLQFLPCSPCLQGTN